MVCTLLLYIFKYIHVNMKGKTKMIILGVKNSESEIEHDRVLCVLRNVLGLLGLLAAQCNRMGASQGVAVLGWERLIRNC